MCRKLLLWLVLSLAGNLVAKGMTVADLQSELAKGRKLTIIDVRAPALFAQGHIPGAINVPASLCPHKRLPALGKVIVCGGGLGRDVVESAAAALGAKPGITADILQGGFAAWEGAHAPGTKGQGLKPETLNYLSYAELKAAGAGDQVLVDLRQQPTPKALAGAGAAAPPPSQPLTDLAQEFPGMRQAQLAPDGALAKSSSAAGSGAPPLLVLIDNGDGAAEVIARRLKAGGVQRYAILAGGELVLSRHGQPGLQRAGSRHALPAPGGATP
jgi:rhodanese-related sulfurtransferase